MYGKKLRAYFPVFVLPTLIAFIISFVIPFISGVYLSFTEFTTVTDARWVGLENYIEVFADKSDFLSALWFTLKFTVVSVITVNVIAFLLALALTRGLGGTNFFRTVFSLLTL